MNNPFATKPFLFLLIPLLIGIVLQYYLEIQYWSILLSCVGIGGMLFSYSIARSKQYSWRWVFGSGAFLVLMAIGIISTAFRQSESGYSFPEESKYYRGVVIDVPQEKAKTMAYRVRLPDYNKQIVCYIEKDSLQTDLNPGEEIYFKSAIQPFRNRGNPDEFDYVRYMHNLGFSGTTYLSRSSWLATGKDVFLLKTEALKCRQKLLDVYRSFDFDDEEFAILSALTLGYRDALTEDMEQSFRTTGTVHILSVSGLHVGVIYAMIAFLLSFVRRSSRCHWIKPALAILLLWLYSYITGLPPSVVRASAMLTVFCAAEIVGRKSYSIHNLYIAAFFMLLYDPFFLFDIGFQLSFLSVLSILYLYPRLLLLISIKNKYIRVVWQLLALSLVAQLATFPLCLYYFGTFPTYFFVANLIVVPLVSFIMYAFGITLVAKMLAWLLPVWGDYILYIAVHIVKLIVGAMTYVVRFVEQLPFSLIEDVNMSFADLLLVSAIILSFICFLLNKRFRPLALAMSFILIFAGARLYDNIADRPNRLVIYNRVGDTDIRWNNNQVEYALTKADLDSYKLIDLNDNKLLVVNSNEWRNKIATNKYEVDYLLLTGDNTISLESLSQLILPRQVILDASLSKQTARRLYKECQKLDIPCYDVTEKGAFSVNF